MSAELRIALLIGLFIAGLVARRLGWLAPRHAGLMLRLVITVGLPALFIADVSRIPLRADLIALPASALAIMLLTMVLVTILVSILSVPFTMAGGIFAGHAHGTTDDDHRGGDGDGAQQRGQTCGEDDVAHGRGLNRVDVLSIRRPERPQDIPAPRPAANCP